MSKKDRANLLWYSRKRNFLGLPWSFTKYGLDQERLYISRGFFTTTEDEIRLYRITDVTLRRTLGQKIFRMGTIHCDSSDVTMQNFDIRNVKNSKAVKDMLSKLVEESRLRNRVFTAENVTAHQHPDPAHGGQPFPDPAHGGQPIPDAHGNPPPPPPIDMTDANGNGVPDTYER